MDDETTTADLDVIHFLGNLTVILRPGGHGGQVTQYGDVVTVTPEMRKLNTDRVGNCWLDIVDDETRQVARWGRVMVRRGPWPADHLPYERGSSRWHDALAAERRMAWQLPSDERTVALREIDERFGPPLTTSQTIATYAGEAARV